MELIHVVMAGLVPAIPITRQGSASSIVMRGTSPRMTRQNERDVL
jgi:hypothetical protein